MALSSIFSNQRYRMATIVAGISTLIYILINYFVIGGDGFVYSLNNKINIPLAIINTLFAFSLWNLVKIGRNNRLLWGGVVVGLGTLDDCRSSLECLWVFVSGSSLSITG